MTVLLSTPEMRTIKIDILANLKYKTHFVKYSHSVLSSDSFVLELEVCTHWIVSLILPHWEMPICILGTFLYCFVLTFLLSCMNSLYVRSNISLVICQYFSFCSLHFHFAVFLEKPFQFDVVLLVCFSFCCLCFRVLSKNTLLRLVSRGLSPVFSSRNSKVFSLYVYSLINSRWLLCIVYV